MPFLLSVILTLPACESSPPPTITSDLPVTPIVTPRPNETLAPTIPPSAATTGAINLVIWMSDEFASVPAAADTQVLSTTLKSFQTTYPDIGVSLLVKKAYGKGGIADLLAATRAALPQTLPDIVTLDLRELPRLARDGAVQPFSSRFAPLLLSDWYPFARQAAQVDGSVFAVPFTADVLQLAYDSAQLKTPPLTWTDLISNSAKYALALGGENGLVSDSFLAQYVALGGRFGDVRGKPALDRGPLRDALEVYRNGVAQGIVISNTLNLKTLDESWNLYKTGKVTLVDASARQFLRERNPLKAVGFAAIPTRDGNLATISRSWGYAIVTKDPSRQAAAEKFIEWMVGAENNASWNRAANRLPARKGVLSLWSSDSTYRDFVNQLLGVAVNRPATTSDNTLDAALQTALVDVLANRLTPADAADKALAALSR